MQVPIVLVFLGLLIFGAHFFQFVFDKTKVPNALWFLIIGIVLGPVLGLVRMDHFGAIGPVFTTATLIIILFESGVNLKIKDLSSSIGVASLLTLTNFILSSVIASCIAYYFAGLDDWVSASFFGAIVGGTSSAIVIPIVKQLKMNQSGETILILESALSDVLCLVIGLALLTAMGKGIFSLIEVVNSIWKSFLISGAVGSLVGVVWSVILDRLRKLQNHTFINLAMVFVVAGMTDMFGLSSGIAVLGFGIAIGNGYLFRRTKLKKVIHPNRLLNSEKSFFSEIGFILQTYFFVYIGVSIKFGDPMIFAYGLLAVVAIIAVRPLTVRLFVRGLNFKDMAIMSVLTPKGLVPAILASLPLQMGIVGGETIQDLAFSVVLFSIFVCSILVVILSKDPFAIGYLKDILGGSTEIVDSDIIGQEDNEAEISKEQK